jgi:hypothetical protein
MDLKALGDLIEVLRNKGVVEFEGGAPSMRLVLGPLPIAHLATVEREAEPKLAEPVRDDGLTKQQAEDLYWSSGG